MLILASNSPRRQYLLSQCGYKFSVHPVDVDEEVFVGEKPQKYVLRIAERKAREVSKLFETSGSDEIIVVAADTCVVDTAPNHDGKTGRHTGDHESGGSQDRYEILGKPATYHEAISVLKRLRGRAHQVYSAVVLLNHQTGMMSRDVCVTEVPMRNYLDEEIIQYINTGDSFDKAGGYAIQHADFHPVQNLQGCFANVMGLPLCSLKRLLDRVGIHSPTAVDQICNIELGYICPIHERVMKGEFSLFENRQVNPFSNTD